MAKETNQYRLQELDDSKYEIIDQQPDIDGWSIYDVENKKVGKVKDMLFDPQERKVRCIIAKLKGNDFGVDSRKVLIPIGVAHLDNNDDHVVLPMVNARQLAALPEYKKGELTASDEYEIMQVFSLSTGNDAHPNAYQEANIYSHPNFDDQNFFGKRPGGHVNAKLTGSNTIPVIEEQLEVGKREVETGGIRLRSRIVQEPVEKRITLQEEHVAVERTPVNRPANAAAFREEEIEVNSEAEVPVVNKEARVVEEIRARKEVTEENRVIRDTLKKTEVDIEKDDNRPGRTSGSGL